MPITKLTPENNYPYLEDRLKALEQAVPEALADGKANWDTLREVLGENLEDEGRDEYFGLNWPGKRAARKRAATPSRATLVPAPGEGMNEGTTENLFIEGDNLEVLKLLQKSYAGKIKMIYIDPPYNTGNDFIYNDNFTDPLEAYLDYTGARGESGELLTTNTRADGRYHSKWLNMIYPRLILARQLLREDGVIFVSIDDTEVHNLRHILTEVFGEENFISQVVWQRSFSPVNLKHHFSQNHDHLIVFAKYISQLEEFMLPRTDEANSRYSNPDNDPRGDWTSGGLDVGPAIEKNIYPITTPSGRIVLPPNGYSWRYSKEKFQEQLGDNRISFGENGNNVPRIKRFLSEVKEGITPLTVWTYEEVGHNQDARKETKELFAGEAVFDYPKPVKYIRRMLDIGANKNNSIVLDFFAGSATTAHAVLEKNIKDHTNIKFIMVQLPEKTNLNNYSTVADIGKERIRRVIKSIETTNSEEASKTPLLQNEQTNLDLGFKVFKYSRSNYKQWKPLQEESAESLTPLFDNLSDPLVQGWKKEDLLSEVLLMEGFPLTSKVSFLEDLLKNQVYRISAPDFCAHDLFVCLDETVQPVTIDLLTMEKEDIFICLDSALSDELKARVQDKFNVHVI